jgi:hypothetical protein
MFSHLQAAPTDPILGLMAAYTQDTRPFKIDLGVGVYKDEAGNTPILACVKEAEARRGRNETTKTYIGMAGDPGFNAQIDQLSLGGARALVDQRVATAHTPGGTGALRVAADLIKRCRPEATVWMSDPTWGNHPAVFKAAGLAVHEYPYYDPATQSLRADAMFDAVAQVPAGDVVLLHACCHNPSGVDLAPEHWQRVAEMAQTTRLRAAGRHGLSRLFLGSGQRRLRRSSARGCPSRADLHNLMFKELRFVPRTDRCRQRDRRQCGADHGREVPLAQHNPQQLLHATRAWRADRRRDP